MLLIVSSVSPSGLSVKSPSNLSICSRENLLFFTNDVTFFVKTSAVLFLDFGRMTRSWTSTCQPSEAFGGSGGRNSLAAPGASPEAFIQESSIGLSNFDTSFQSLGLSIISASSSGSSSVSAAVGNTPCMRPSATPPTGPHDAARSPALLLPLLLARWSLRFAKNMPPYSTFSSLLPPCEGIIVTVAPTQSPCVTRTKFRFATVLLWRNVRKRSA
mmetsp:Transcript_20959/g.59407  ORF Transcript_20959/g.59407 Transcript_20959/m.59407 type:complete len:215 (-) Transcript_20959:181-825(-)